MNADDRNILARGRVATRLPAQDLDRARRFYAEQLGLEPVDERPGGLLYRCGGTDFALFESAGTSPGTFTQMGWEVDDIETVVSELRQLYRLDRVDRAIRRVGSPRGAGCGYQAAAVSWLASLRRPAPHDDSAAD
ncbi:VOC family protein [Streptomyces sp. V4I2]|uniref:VOC family protein n=1 Tax=Streptomyces sp. V4I2 TaxID=3042280 RepID=UPI0027843006|nr:VOC family protein [Streptomyces sp. V4I2]MDQ1050812.1 catechol 2,3-dioxygenase-like lactoylglutathione lyase family enzyme [Streptomyces sp. V4I2]